MRKIYTFMSIPKEIQRTQKQRHKSLSKDNGNKFYTRHLQLNVQKSRQILSMMRNENLPKLSAMFFKHIVNAVLLEHYFKVVKCNNTLSTNDKCDKHANNTAFTLTVRLIDEKESATLNGQYRNKNTATNILSFPFISFSFASFASIVNAKKRYDKITTKNVAVVAAEEKTQIKIILENNLLLENLATQDTAQDSNFVAKSLALGDLAICVPLVQQEAIAQYKTFLAHITHLVVHGALHLLGYTHNTSANAALMEAQEIIILKKLGYKNPYA